MIFKEILWENSRILIQIRHVFDVLCPFLVQFSKVQYLNGNLHKVAVILGMFSNCRMSSFVRMMAIVDSVFVAGTQVCTNVDRTALGEVSHLWGGCIHHLTRGGKCS